MHPTARSRANRWIPPLSAAGVVLAVSSIATSVLAYGVLPEQVRIRWTIGTFYGPEYASTIAVLAAFPVMIAALYGGSELLKRALQEDTGFEEVRWLYEAGVLAALAFVLLVQIAIVVANVYSL